MSKLRRYRGAQPFETEHAALFFGREEDTQNLLRLISKERLVVFFAKSGHGKSSLINAGVIPRLNGVFRDQTVVHRRIRFDNTTLGRGEISLTDAVVLLLDKERHFTERTDFYEKYCSQPTLWYHFKRRQSFPQADKPTEVFVLFFQQFEEFFLHPPEQQSAFRQQLSELLYTDIPQHIFDVFEALTPAQQEHLSAPLDVRVIFEVRSDRLSLLDSMRTELPDILTKRYGMAALSEAQARDAIIKPAIAKSDIKALGELASDPFEFSEKAVDKIIDELTKTAAATNPSITTAGQIESFQLQIICDKIETMCIEQNEKNKTLKLIREEDLPEFSKVYEDYYRDKTMMLGSHLRKAARILIEDELIHVDEASGIARRLSVDADVLKRNLAKIDISITDRLLNELENNFLIRRETNSTSGVSYEISHDTLLAPILKSRTERVRQIETNRDKGLEATVQEKLKEIKQLKEMLVTKHHGETEPRGVDFDRLIDDIQNKKCVLFIGPDFLTVEGMSLHMHFLHQIIIEQQYRFGKNTIFWENEALFQFEDARKKFESKIQLIKLYKQPLSPENEYLLAQLAQMPFYTIASLSPDTYLRDIMLKLNIQHEFGYLERYGRQKEFNNSDVPIIYNFFGVVDDLDSIILDQDDLFGFLESIFRGQPLPINLWESLNRANSIIFLGFPFERWFMQLFLHFFINRSKSRNILFVNDQIANDNGVRQYLSLKFRSEFYFNQREFLDELYNRLIEQNLLRKVEHERDVLGERVIQYLSTGDLKKALDILQEQMDYITSNALQDEISLLDSTYIKIEKDNQSGLISPEIYKLEMNKIILRTVELSHKIAGQLK